MASRRRTTPRPARTQQRDTPTPAFRGQRRPLRHEQPDPIRCHEGQHGAARRRGAVGRGRCRRAGAPRDGVRVDRLRVHRWRRAPGPRPTRVGGLRHDPTGVAPGRHLGDASLIGPGDPARGIDVPFLLRDVFRAAGGSHEDRDEYDRAMRDDPASGRLRPPRPRARHRMTWPSRRHSGGTEAVPPSTSSRFPHDVADGIAHRADSGVEPRRTGSGSLRVGASCRTTSGGRRASSSAGPSRTCCPSSRRCVDPKVCRAAIRSRSG